MTTKVEQATQALLARVQTLADTATASESAYLGKTIEAIYGERTVLDIQAAGQTQIAALATQSQSELLQIEAAGTQIIEQASAKLAEIAQSITQVTAAYPFTLAANTITYDEANRITSLTEGNKSTDQISYNRAGQITGFRERVTLNNQTTARLYSVSYDAAGRISQISFQ